MKICQITSVHFRHDTRIFVKECKALAKAGFETYLLVADGQGDEEKDGVNIIDIGKRETKRIKRATKTGKKILKKAIEIDADIYHFHDPELLLISKALLKKGKKVIYDVHEDVPRQILTKGYLNKNLTPLISSIYEKFELKKASKLTAIVCAEPVTRKRFEKINKNTIEVKNFPKHEEFNNTVDWESRKNHICYIGAISGVRGIREIVKALENVDTKLHLAGTFVPKELEEEIKKYPGWSKVIYYGFANRKKIAEILSTVKIGLVTLHPIPKYLEAYPVKMFEYMVAGTPILASDFKLYKNILEEAKCGYTVNPLDVDKIAETLRNMLNNDKELEQMSINGKEIAKIKYNWSKEEEKLINLYQKIN